MDLTNDGLDVVELRSADGLEWKRRVVDIGGPRNVAAGGDGAVVAIGYTESSQVWASDSQPVDDADTSGRSSNVWIRRD